MVDLNQQWQEILPSVKETIIIADRQFYWPAADQFTIVLVDDETGKAEQPYQTILESAFAEQVIRSVYDLPGFFLHVASHHRCDVLWSKCPTPMCGFTPDQLDFVEEIYNQRLVNIVAPTYYEAFPAYCITYGHYKGYNDTIRLRLQTAFTQQCDTGNSMIDQLHRWLYQCDPLHQLTFNGYMQAWALLLADQSVSNLIQRY